MLTWLKKLLSHLKKFAKKHKIITSIFILIALIAFWPSNSPEPGSLEWKMNKYASECERGVEDGMLTTDEEYKICTEELGYEITGVEPKEELDLNGTVINEACETLRDNGWSIWGVDGVNGGMRTEESDCSDTTNKVTDVYYYQLSRGVEVNFASKIEYQQEDESTDIVDDTATESEDTQEADEATDTQADEATNIEADSQEDYLMPDDISIYDIQSLCERYAENKGYVNAEIKNIQGLDMENGSYYRVGGTLYIDEGFTASEKAVGTYTCVADYNEWTVVSAFLNGQGI